MIFQFFCAIFLRFLKALNSLSMGCELHPHGHMMVKKPILKPPQKSGTKTVFKAVFVARAEIGGTRFADRRFSCCATSSDVLRL